MDGLKLMDLIANEMGQTSSWCLLNVGQWHQWYHSIMAQSVVSIRNAKEIKKKNE